MPRCPICSEPSNQRVADVAGHAYHLCAGCGSIFIDPEVLDRLDRGEPVVRYDDTYWAEELRDARERAFGPALARMSEAVHYARIPVRRFLDIGSGPGYFLDAVARYLPSRADRFWGVEKFPPPAERRTKSPRFIVGDVADIGFQVDGGICIEVVEHLTPRMYSGLLASLAKVSTPGALYVFNTGMPEYVLHEDRGYLDPVRRGHVVSYSLAAVRLLTGALGFEVRAMRGKTWAYALEYRPARPPEDDISGRIWTALPENLELLTDPEMGSALRILGLESVRAYAVSAPPPAPTPPPLGRRLHAMVREAIPWLGDSRKPRA